MEMIEAVIAPQQLEAVQFALARVGILGATALDCRGVGSHPPGHSERYRSAGVEVTFLPRVLLQLCVKSSERGLVLATIARAARTGSAGDGTIFVHGVTSATRIRNGEVDDCAL